METEGIYDLHKIWALLIKGLFDEDNDDNDHDDGNGSSGADNDVKLAKILKEIEIQLTLSVSSCQIISLFIL